MLFELFAQADPGGIPIYVIILVVIALGIGGFLLYKQATKTDEPESTPMPSRLRTGDVPRVQPTAPQPYNAFAPDPAQARTPTAPKRTANPAPIPSGVPESSASVPKKPQVQNATLAARQNIKQSIASGAKLTVDTEPVAPVAAAPAAPAPAPERDFSAADVIHEADVLRKSGRRDLAAKKLREFLGRYPTNAGVLEILGDVLAESEDLAAAAEAYRQSVKANPQSARACNSLAKVLEQLGDIPGAIAAYRAATYADPADHKAFNNLGGLLAETGDMVAGVEAFRKALAINPNDEAAQENLALAEELLREQTATH